MRILLKAKNNIFVNYSTKEEGSLVSMLAQSKKER